MIRTIAMINQKGVLQNLNGFDMILLDCLPNLGLLTLNALTAANEVFVPLQAEFLSIKGLNKLMEMVEKVKDRVNPSIKISGIIPTQFDSRLKLHTRSKWEASSKTAKTKSTTKAAPKVSESAIEKQRTIFVAYNKATGDIVATQELMLDNANDSDIPWSGIPDNITAKSFKLIEKLADKELIEIHRNYKVTGSGELELKQS